jgi:hypothetical protein
MPGAQGNRRLTLGLLLVAGIAAALVGAAVTLSLAQAYRAADYPGSIRVSDHRLTKAGPHPHFRRNTSYRTSDPFPVVYNWYSSGFQLGPEVRAQSGCILMARSSTVMMIERSMSVTLCDTPNGRMIFVMRSISLRYRP